MTNRNEWLNDARWRSLVEANEAQTLTLTLDQRNAIGEANDYMSFLEEQLQRKTDTDPRDIWEVERDLTAARASREAFQKQAATLHAQLAIYEQAINALKAAFDTLTPSAVTEE